MVEGNATPTPTPPEPWVRFGNVALNGRRELGVCRVELERDIGLFRAESLTDETPVVTYFSRGSVYAFKLLNDGAVQAAIAAAVERRAAVRAREEKKRAEREARFAKVRADVRDVELAFGEHDADVRISWSGETTAIEMRTAMYDVLNDAGREPPWFEAHDHALVAQHGCWPSALRRALLQFVQDLGGTVEGDADLSRPDPIDEEFDDGPDDDLPL